MLDKLESHKQKWISNPLIIKSSDFIRRHILRVEEMSWESTLWYISATTCLSPPFLTESLIDRSPTPIVYPYWYIMCLAIVASGIFAPARSYICMEKWVAMTTDSGKFFVRGQRGISNPCRESKDEEKSLASSRSIVRVKVKENQLLCCIQYISMYLLTLNGAIDWPLSDLPCFVCM